MSYNINRIKNIIVSKNKILLFAGSINSQSVNRKIVEQAARMLNSHQTRLIDLRDFPTPIFSVDPEEKEGVPQLAYKLNKLFQKHDALIVSVAENNASVASCFKNTMDWVSRTQDKYEKNMFGTIFNVKSIN